ncbi:DUF6644 family protein [Novosphingobium pentaromativorans]|uniref:DUF6644 domain-containing protein n=1 Tax=Novosphingobium pentaromativorans US6-1 TaxID=1088721 RepID=G6EEQ8_9SPHN|nr:DUF6644 family protein [Novosphingobium pentaromativorans]AIT79359.1 hypothetical protein JI59_05955 [Novosphingobium pentaromativorans US6-1]EHJ60204.1 hypothetical protein NSU_2829 [Novosphingobium pentaromativorans US6-1]
MGSVDLSFLSDLESLGVAQFVRESSWAYPTLETLHVIAIALVVGSIWIVDLRILGLVFQRRAVQSVMDEVLPLTWCVFALALITGVLMFISSAMMFAENPAFRIKLVVLVCAALNVLFFHSHAMKRWQLAGGDALASPAMKISGGASIVFWISAILAGRWIGFL